MGTAVVLNGSIFEFIRQCGAYSSQISHHLNKNKSIVHFPSFLRNRRWLIQSSSNPFSTHTCLNHVKSGVQLARKAPLQSADVPPPMNIWPATDYICLVWVCFLLTLIRRLLQQPLRHWLLVNSWSALSSKSRLITYLYHIAFTLSLFSYSSSEVLFCHLLLYSYPEGHSKTLTVCAAQYWTLFSWKGESVCTLESGETTFPYANKS